MEALYFSEHDEPVALAIAAAEHRVRSAVIADLKAMLESPHTVEGSPYSTPNTSAPTPSAT